MAEIKPLKRYFRFQEKWGPVFWMQTSALMIVWNEAMLDEGEPFDAPEIFKVVLVSITIHHVFRN